MRAVLSRRITAAAAAALVAGGALVLAPAANAAPTGGPAGNGGTQAMVEPPVPASAVRRTTMATAAPDVVAGDAVPERIGGADRYATAAQIAAEFGTSNAVVVANGSDAKGGYDALAANYLAGELHAPILLTAGVSLESTVATAVTNVLTGSTDPAIYVMGGSDAVSAAAAAALNAIASGIAGTSGDYVHRVGGDSRYQTAALAAQEVNGATAGTVDLGMSPHYTLPTAILASGTVNADALAAGPLSNAWGLPVLLTPAGSLPTDASRAIGALGIQQLLVLGGPDRVSDAVISQAKAAGVQRVQRVAGANRFATAASLYTLARSTFADASGAHYAASTQAFLANGASGFPDALAAGPLAGALGAPLLTVSANSADLSTLTFLAGAKSSITAITVLGTAPTVGQAVLIAGKSALGLNIARTSTGTLADGTNAAFLAAVAPMTTFRQKIDLARSYLPGGGNLIQGTIDIDPGDGIANAAGLTFFPTCEVWIDDTLPDSVILDILRHEYIHVLQCRAENQKVNLGYAASDTAVGGIERGADAGAYLLGSNYMYYVDYSTAASPLRVSEILTAQALLARFKITYVVG